MKFPARPHTAREWSRFLATRSLTKVMPTAPHWEIDPTPAIKALGLEIDVRVQRVGHSHWALAEGSAGAYKLVHGEVHHVWLSEKLPAWLASASTWHELTHAAQCEHEFGADYDFFYSRYMAHFYLNVKHIEGGIDFAGYARIPFERQAYLNMNKHFKTPLLTTHA